MMPHYLYIEDGRVVLRREYPSDADKVAAREGKLMIVWLEDDPGRAEVLYRRDWERVEEIPTQKGGA